MGKRRQQLGDVDGIELLNGIVDRNSSAQNPNLRSSRLLQYFFGYIECL